mgnify:CR=1 FL=1|jgi:hypothetical protein
MNNLLDMLVKTGYEVSSIGNDVLPCTLRIGNEPIGFLLGDLSVRLLPEHENERARLTPVINFAAENRGAEPIGEEFKLSQYKDVIFTAAFDYSICKPLYNVYRQDKDKTLTLLNSSEDKAEAARDFASRSGLVDGNITPQRETDRIGKFIKFVKDKGYAFRENREDANRAYDIIDKDGHIAGFIGKDNKVTITTDNKRINRTLRDAYIDSNTDNNMLPSFFEKLKERLKEIGLALKVIFTPHGKHFAINNRQQQEVASVSETRHTVTYTDAATNEQKAQIDALVDELRSESHEKEFPSAEKETTNRTKAEPQKLAATAAEVRNVAEAVLSDSEMAAVFFNTVLSSPDFVSRLSEKMKDMPQQVKNEHAPEKQNPKANDIKQEFSRYYGLLQTTFGFNSEKYNNILFEMKEKFGTTDPKEFRAMLQENKVNENTALRGRLQTSQNIANIKNNAQQHENTHEKERA